MLGTNVGHYEIAAKPGAGPFPFNEGLSVSLQIAQALEEPHEKGIVHRDSKPRDLDASLAMKVDDSALERP